MKAVNNLTVLEFTAVSRHHDQGNSYKDNIELGLAHRFRGSVLYHHDGKNSSIHYHQGGKDGSIQADRVRHLVLKATGEV